MKKTFLSLLLICTAIVSAKAQKWTTGLRTGIEQVNTNLDENDFKSNNLLWHNQAFLSRHFGRWFEVEAALGYSDHTSSAINESWPNRGTFYYHRLREQNVTLLLSSRFYLYRINRLHLFVQAGFTFLKTFSSFSTTIYAPNQAQPQYYRSENNQPITTFRFFAGPGLRYYASSRFFLTGNLNVYYKTDALSSMVADTNEWTTGLYLGGGFHF